MPRKHKREQDFKSQGEWTLSDFRQIRTENMNQGYAVLVRGQDVEIPSRFQEVFSEFSNHHC